MRRGNPDPGALRAGGLRGKAVVGMRVTPSHVLNKIRGDVSLPLDGGAAMLAIGLGVAVGVIDLVRGNVKVLVDYARGLDGRENAGLRGRERVRGERRRDGRGGGRGRERRREMRGQRRRGLRIRIYGGGGGGVKRHGWVVGGVDE